MGRTNDPRRLCLHFENWPPQDRALWEAGTAIRPRSFKGPRYAETLRPASIAKAQEGYGRWLGSLACYGNLDPAKDPADRLTVPARDDFLELLIELENAAKTIVGRLTELHMAFKIMVPGGDFDWILKFNGVPISTLLPMRKRLLAVHHPLKLFRWGLELMKEAWMLEDIRERCETYRDGLMICILASRAPRLRSLTGIRIGQHLTKGKPKYHLAFEPEDMKTKRALDYDLPITLTEYIDHYLAVERRVLLEGETHDYLWVGVGGAPIKPTKISTMIRARSTPKFGEGFGPHRFRHCIGTAAPMEDPQRPGIAPAMLGITPSTHEDAYNLAGQIEASHSYVDVIRQARANSRRKGGTAAL